MKLVPIAVLFFAAVLPVRECRSAETAAPAPAQARNSNNMFPQWSHDGKRIVFTSDRDGDPEIYVMDAAGTNVTRLTHSPGRDAHPYFTLDNTKIVFQSPRGNRFDTNLYVMKSDGSEVIPLTNLKGFAGVAVCSPDQKSIAFQWRETSDFHDAKKWLICLINTDGSNFRAITSGQANDQVPNWSGDGKRLIFYSDRMAKDQIYTMKADGTDVQRVSNSDSNDTAASWSPDGKKIAFTSDRSGNNEIYVMTTDATQVRRLTNTKATERAAIWSPNGDNLLFSSDGDGPSNIYVMNSDGSKIVNLVK